MNELIKINCETADRPTVMGRELHEALGIKSNYTTWFNRMCEYGFTENSDYVTCFPNLESENQHGGQNKADHAITIDMANEICMIQRSEIGEKVEFKIEEFITDTLNVRSLRDVPNGRLEEALSLSKKFKPDEKLRGAIAEAREKLKQKGA